jgi:hypothetical protein
LRIFHISAQKDIKSGQKTHVPRENLHRESSETEAGADGIRKFSNQREVTSLPCKSVI